MKILYGVPSEGMGHATRSKLVIQFLLDEGHEVLIVSSGKAFAYLKQFFGETVVEIEGFHLAYKNAKVSIAETALLSFKKAPNQLIKNFETYRKILAEHTFNFIISDFESFANFYAKANSLPLLSIDNMQVINRCTLDIEIPNAELINFNIAKTIIKFKVPKANKYLITSFFRPEIRKKNTQFVGPIIRTEILNTKPSIKNHILVYQTSATADNLIEKLNGIPNETFYVYGFNKEEVHGNVILKAFSEAEFIQRFASAKAVMSNGGFSFLSEAVYLGKPVFSVPIQNQFEQFVNASYIQKLGFGKMSFHFDKDIMQSFLYELPLYQKNVSRYKQNGNEELLKEIKLFLKSL